MTGDKGIKTCFLPSSGIAQYFIPCHGAGDLKAVNHNMASSDFPSLAANVNANVSSLIFLLPAAI